MMKRMLFFVWFVIFSTVSFAQYVPDELGAGFQKRTIELKDDYEGKVIATLIKYENEDTASRKGALLYVHGFNDYFFQWELAEKVTACGYAFYAVDLRKYGRSLLPSQRRFNVRNVDEYYEEIDAALAIIKSEGNKEVVLMGHSTGGLITTMYVDDRGTSTGVEALICNSPYYEQNSSWFVRKIAIPIVSLIGKIFPNILYKQSGSSGYAESLLKAHKGEWEFDTAKKLMISPSITYSWIGAISRAQRKLHRIESTKVPTLVLHSDKSTWDADYSEAYTNSDAVLNVADIDRYARHMGSRVEVVKDGLHDLSLSAPAVRNDYYSRVCRFLGGLPTGDK